MTPEQFRQKLQERRKSFAADIEKAEMEIRQLTTLAAHASAHVVEIDYALEQLDPASPQSEPQSVEKAKRPYRKKPRAVENSASGGQSERTNARTPETEPPSDGAGTSDEMPAFLRRSKETAE